MQRIGKGVWKKWLETLDYYKANKEKYKLQKTNVLQNVCKFYKERKMIAVAFENDIFPLPHQYHQEWMDGKKMKWIYQNSY